MSTDTRWDAWLEANGANETPSHRVKITLEVEIDLLLPPWTDADDALTECMTTLGGLSPDWLVCQEWSYDNPQIGVRGGRITGSLGAIEAVTP